MGKLATLVLLGAIVATGASATPQKGWSVARQPAPSVHHAVLMSDSAYAAISAMPIDSLNARQYDMLMRERQLRATTKNEKNPVATGFLVTSGVLVALFIVGHLLSGGR